jgi:hypothetical protein
MKRREETLLKSTFDLVLEINFWVVLKAISFLILLFWIWIWILLICFAIWRKEKGENLISPQEDKLNDVHRRSS